MKKYTNESLWTLFLYFVDKILRRKNLDNGLILTSPKKIEKDGDFVHQPLGFSLTGKKVIKEDGNFLFFRPEGQQQNIGSEKMHCVSESDCNTIQTVVNFFLHLIDNGKATKEQIEIVNVFRAFGLIKKIDGKEECLLSTRYVAAGSGTTIRGNGQKIVVDFIRHYGLVADDDFPYVNDWTEYYYTGDTSINGNKLPSDLIKKGQKLLEYIEFSYEWVHPNNIIDTYKYGALQTVVYAWNRPVNGIYQRTTNKANHATQGDGFDNYHLLFDSYAPFDKKLVPNFYTQYAMLITIKLKKPMSPYNIDFIRKLRKKGWKYVLLINDVGEYKRGAYELKDDKIVSANIEDVVDDWVKQKAEKGELEGISTDDFKKLINLA